MYMMEYMVKSLIDGKVEWKSPDHEKVWLKLVIANPKVRTASAVINYAKAVNDIPQSKIRTVTFRDLEEAGVL